MCNGDCYQGRWCDCADEKYDSEEYRRGVIFSVFWSVSLTAILFTLLYVFIL